jgi:hypothetical protein
MKYIVRRGDTALSIAKAFTGDASRWTELVRLVRRRGDGGGILSVQPGDEVEIPRHWQPLPRMVAVPNPRIALGTEGAWATSTWEEP